MKKLSTLIATFALLAGITAPLAVAAPALASNESALCEGSGGTWRNNKCESADGRTVTGTLQQITDVLIFLIGAIAVIMIIIGGLRYVTSAGDQAALTGAKNTILYSIVGLIVAFMAYAIVRFIFAAFNIN
jgi:hypothetical protein